MPSVLLPKARQMIICPLLWCCVPLQSQRVAFLVTELKGKRPLLPPCMETSPDVQEVIDTLKCVFQLNLELGAWFCSSF